MAMSNCSGSTPDDEETEPVELYTPTMAQDNNLCVNDNYVLCRMSLYIEIYF